MKALSKSVAMIAAAGIITQGQLIWPLALGAMCLPVLAVLAFVVCSKDGDHRAAILERVINAFKSHPPEPRRKQK